MPPLPEFFDAEQHPEIIFESKQISRDGDRVVVDGELTIKGITKKVAARGKIAGPAPGPDADRVGIDVETIVDRMSTASTGRWICRAGARPWATT